MTAAPLGKAWKSALAKRGGKLSFIILLGAVVIAALGPGFLPDPAVMVEMGAGAAPPSPAHPLGTDPLGRDMLSRLVYGGRISLSIALIAVAVSVTIGTCYGAISGYLSGWVDLIMMRLVDAGLAIPRLMILMLLFLVWERIPIVSLALVIGATGWLGTARIVRGEVQRLRHADFILAARAVGASPTRIIIRHLIPNVAGPVSVAATLAVAEVILLEAGLSFLGIGVQPPTPSWGGMILDARPVLLEAPWTSLAPGIAIVVVVLAANLLGDALRTAMDPRGA